MTAFLRHTDFMVPRLRNGVFRLWSSTIKKFPTFPCKTLGQSRLDNQKELSREWYTNSVSRVGRSLYGSQTKVLVETNEFRLFFEEWLYGIKVCIGKEHVRVDIYDPGRHF